jgi:hypothetical protein
MIAKKEIDNVIQLNRKNYKNGSNDTVNRQQQQLLMDIINMIEYTDDSLSSYINIIKDQDKEIAMLKSKANKSIPIYTAIYLCVNSCIFCMALLLFTLHFFAGVTIIPQYILLLCIIGSAGLWSTAYTSIRSWKEIIG